MADICKGCGKSFHPLTKRTRIYCNKRCKYKLAQKDRDVAYKKATGYEPPPASTSQGTISEIRVMEDLLRRGYMVFRNCTPHGSTDIVALARGPNTVPLRLEVKTVYSFDAPLRGRHKHGVYFDHWARVKREGGEVQYVPPMPDVTWEWEDEANEEL